MSNENKETDRIPKIVLHHPGGEGINISNVYYTDRNESLSDKGEVIGHFCISEDTDTNSEFIRERTALHKLMVQEGEKTKRVSLIIAASLLIVAIVIMVFAPVEKQTLSYWFGASLLIISAGAAGYKRFWFKSKVVSLKAEK